MAEGFVCQVCNNSKANLERITSRFVPGWEINICSTCKNKKYEPRFLLVLAARSGPMSDKLKSAIKSNLYCGESITADDIL